ncbi:MAG: hypothetical protein H0T91_01415 [Propionibacteriaceae bacterium]|nr:hypothetical protein [Propionibacteriaceae bacterium]
MERIKVIQHSFESSPCGRAKLIGPPPDPRLVKIIGGWGGGIRRKPKSDTANRIRHDQRRPTPQREANDGVCQRRPKSLPIALIRKDEEQSRIGSEGPGEHACGLLASGQIERHGRDDRHWHSPNSRRSTGNVADELQHTTTGCPIADEHRSLANGPYSDT